MGVIIDSRVEPQLFEALKIYNKDCFKSFNCDFIYTPVNTHPDMQIHFTDCKTAVVAPVAYQYYKNILPDTITLIKGNSNPGRTYPEDCAYNVARMGKKIIGKLSNIDNKILEIYTQNGFEFVDVKQGYTKCNLCIIDENSAITEDEGVFKTLCSKGMDVLKIPVGFVSLKGFKNGFIGGASGFVAPNKIAFWGSLQKHPYCHEIEAFIRARNVDIIYLSSNKPEDYGSILYFDSSFSK